MAWRFASVVLAVALWLGGVASALAEPIGSAANGPVAQPTFQIRPGSPGTMSALSVSPVGYSPTQIRHAYGFDQLTLTGAGQTIAIVDAYDAPTIASDLRVFINTNGLRAMNGLPGTTACTVVQGPHPCFQKLFSAGPPTTDAGWGIETSLDVEWAHAVAPAADLLLVEAPSSGVSDLLTGVDTAVSQGARVVSMSWGTGEYATETSDDHHFNHAGVTFTAAAGDGGAGVLWPAASPFVVSVGGTSLSLDSAGDVLSETAWSGSGGGASTLEAEPVDQSAVGLTVTGGKRGVPDVAYVADPFTGVGIYDTTAYEGMSGWIQVGGTSTGAPQWAALIALADQARGGAPLSSTNATPSLYGMAVLGPYGASFRDIVSGSDGACSTCTAAAGYDLVSGLGSPWANGLIPSLARSSPLPSESTRPLLVPISPADHPAG